MTEIQQLQHAVEGIQVDVKAMLQRQAETAAKLQITSEEARAQRGVLFAREEKSSERVQKIELDYTPRREHDSLKLRIEVLDRQVAKWIGALALLQIVLSLAGAWIVRMVTG